MHSWQDLITPLPVELIKEIGSCLDYSEVQTFRLVSTRVNSAVEAIALSRLKLDWSFFSDTDDGPTQFPLAKLQAYISPGQTRGFYLVRHLTINNACLAFLRKKCSLDAHIQISPPDLDMKANSLSWMYQTTERLLKKRASFYGQIMKDLLLGESLKGLKTIRWDWTASEDHSSVLDAHMERCRLDLFARNIFMRENPVQRLDLDIRLFELVLALHSNEQQEDPQKQMRFCKELRVINHDKQSPYVDPFPWLKEVIFNSPCIEALDTNVVIDTKLLGRLFDQVHSRSKTSNEPAVQLRTLNLVYEGSRLDSCALRHFRHLQKLVLWWRAPPETPEQSHSAIRDRNSSLWLQLSEERIYVQDLTVTVPHVEHSLLDYLTALPRSTLKRLTLKSPSIVAQDQYRYCSTYIGRESFFYHSYHSEGIPTRFYAQTLPHIASGLEELSITSDRFTLDWCVGTLPESLIAFKKCRALIKLCVTLDCVIVESAEVLVHQVFDRCHLLCSVGTYDISTGEKSGTIRVRAPGTFDEDSHSLFGDVDENDPP